jgi:chromosome segregation ATPase
MEQILHQTKLYLVELEDKPSTAEKLQHHQQLLDHVSRSVRSVKQNHQNLTSEIADLKSKLESEIAKTLKLTDDVQDLKEIVLQQNTKIAEQNTKIAEQNTIIAKLTTRIEYQKYARAIQDIYHHLELKVFNLHKLRRQRVEIPHFIDDNDGLDLRNYKASFALTQFNKMSPSCQDKFRTKFGPNFLTQFSDEVKNIGLVVGFVSDDDVAETAEWWDE